MTAPDLAAVVLAAGLGTRLRPLTDIRPKALCPVANVPLVDLALARAGAVTPDLAVNVHHHREQLEVHLAGRVHLSAEKAPLGTAGAVGLLREWIAPRGALVVNADAWSTIALDDFAASWDGTTVRLLVVERPGEFGPFRFAGASLLPWVEARRLEPVPSGLYESVWARHEGRGTLELFVGDGDFVDCGTPSRYLQANLVASGGASVVGPGATVDGDLVRSVVWPGATVRRGERLVECVRATDSVTVAAPQDGQAARTFA